MIIILLGIISGIYSGFGMGGGTILIFCLTTFLGIEQHTAQATNLVFFIPTSIAAIWTNIKNKNVNLKLAAIISFFGIIGAIVGAKCATKTNVDSLKRYFGFFLAIIALNEIHEIIKEYIKNKKRHNKNSKYI